MRYDAVVDCAVGWQWVHGGGLYWERRYSPTTISRHETYQEAHRAAWDTVAASPIDCRNPRVEVKA